MKFRYKVLFVNLIILSIVLGFTGYLLVYRNYRQALTMELRNATTENNMVKASVEYELLDLLNSSDNSMNKKVNTSEMGRVIKRVDSSMLLSGSILYVKYGDDYVFSGDDLEQSIPAALLEGGGKDAGSNDISSTGKKYIYHDDDTGHFLYISSPGYMQNASITIITKKDISNVYDQLSANLRFLKIISLVVLFISAITIYLISRFMTRPLEKLNSITTRISGGDYSVRADINSNDEVGTLAENFNQMAGSVEENVEELKNMIHRREQFVADFTHEMKTPMTTIIGYADSVRHLDMTEEERNMSLEYIYTEGKRLETMSQKLFDLLYLKDSTVFMEEQDTAELGAETILHMRPIMERDSISIVSDFEDGEIYGDGELIKTVFINLLDNARKATKAKLQMDSKETREIYFGGYMVDSETDLAKDQDENKKNSDKSSDKSLDKSSNKSLSPNSCKRYEYVVRDNGIGISEEDQKKIFDEFFMGDKSRTRKEGGAGLGMSLVAIILEKHGAEVRIESELGKGTAIYTTWPLYEDDEDI